MTSPSTISSGGASDRIGIDDFGNGRRDVAQIPREDTDLVAALVRLDPRAVQLPLEGDVVVQLHQRSVHVFRRLRQHRLNGLKQLDAEGGETGFAVHDCRACDRGERARHHHRAANRGSVDAARFGDRFDQHTLERALTKLAEQQPDDEVLFSAGGAAQQIAKPLLRVQPSSPHPSWRRCA